MDLSTIGKVHRGLLLCSVLWGWTLSLSGCSGGAYNAESVATPASATAGVAVDDATRPKLLKISKDQLEHLNIVLAHKAAWSIGVHTTGTVDWDADQTTSAITQVSGPISRILVDVGSPVKTGDPLLYVSSPDIANSISAYKKARNREDLSRRVMERQKELFDKGAIAAKEYESSVADHNDALTDVETTLQALEILGISKQQVEESEQQNKPFVPELAVRSPITGTIVQKLVSPGQVIQAGATACFMVSNVSTVWVQGHIFDRDLPSVKVGDQVDVTNTAFDRTFRGVIGYIGVMVDPATRTTPVRIVTQNPQGLLKKDMFLNLVIHTSKNNNVLVVPVAAILRDEQNSPIVYVQSAAGDFARRSVSVGDVQDGQVEVDGGLAEGEKVVADGSLFVQFANAYQ